MITGLGTDIIEIERVRHAFERFGDRYRRRIFTPEEQAYCDGMANALQHYAARWAAKEALVKALGTGFRRGIAWVDGSVLPNALGQPLFRLRGRAAEVAREQGVRSAHVSLSHGRTYAVATVILATTAAEGALVRFDPFRENEA
jgi:holo-[acyl-carrier protein] synthase